jgi:hypothetical protein
MAFKVTSMKGEEETIDADAFRQDGEFTVFTKSVSSNVRQVASRRTALIQSIDRIDEKK